MPLGVVIANIVRVLIYNIYLVAPIYEKIAQELNNPNIILAEYDATANENEEVSIKGFPTLIFYPAKNKAEPVNYDGERNEESIIKFLKEHAT